LNKSFSGIENLITLCVILRHLEAELINMVLKTHQGANFLAETLPDHFIHFQSNCKILPHMPSHRGEKSDFQECDCSPGLFEESNWSPNSRCVNSTRGTFILRRVYFKHEARLEIDFSSRGAILCPNPGVSICIAHFGIEEQFL
jgi:hypothetical protein